MVAFSAVLLHYKVVLKVCVPKDKPFMGVETREDFSMPKANPVPRYKAGPDVGIKPSTGKIPERI